MRAQLYVKMWCPVYTASNCNSDRVGTGSLAKTLPSNSSQRDQRVVRETGIVTEKSVGRDDRCFGWKRKARVAYTGCFATLVVFILKLGHFVKKPRPERL